ncbi:hypothetical protein [Bosea lathyri]|jgi:hypothetical protein|uniref:Uncharacterized protein n=1 Tax=Bosea lathyri TaxID=1036778 RepID=A0A1H5X0G6_9HYPH|nr:hypothetical protein [Bosea lathyri]SEG04870.1 hypothetical protein SAMN04488115_10331 [Bosea lathyri]
MRFLKHLSIVWLVLAALGLATVAQAQAPRGPPCSDRTQVIAHLQSLFGEREIGSGLANGGFVLELFANQSGSWTVFATTPQGLSCLIASGQGWEPVPSPDIFAGR